MAKFLWPSQNIWSFKRPHCNGNDLKIMYLCIQIYRNYISSINPSFDCNQTEAEFFRGYILSVLSNKFKFKFIYLILILSTNNFLGLKFDSNISFKKLCNKKISVTYTLNHLKGQAAEFSKTNITADMDWNTVKLTFFQQFQCHIG